MALDFNLLLRWNAVEASAAGISVDDNDSEAVVGFVADTFECRQSALVNKRFELFGASEQGFLFGAGFAYEVVEVGFLFLKNFGLVFDRSFDICDFGAEIVGLTLEFAYVLCSGR